MSKNLAEAGFDVGTGYFPVPDSRAGVLVGGGSLWLAEDVPREQREAAAELIGWLANPDQQVRWHRETGYFPVCDGAADLLRSEGWFDENPHFATAFDQFQESSDTPATNGAQMGPFPEVRSIIEHGRDEMPVGEDISDALRALNDEVEAGLFSWEAGQ